MSGNYIAHYGIKRRSGRYPWGSGENPYQHSEDFLRRINEYRKQGLSEKEIADKLDISTGELRLQKKIAIHEQRKILVAKVKALEQDGLSRPEIAKKLGLSGESAVRSLLDEEAERRMNAASNTADFLKSRINETGKFIEVGAGVERELNLSRDMMDEALYSLELQGYNVYAGRVPQATNPGKYTTITVLCPPGTEHKEIFQLDNITSVNDYISLDDGDRFVKAFRYPVSMDSSRLQVVYGDEGGVAKDGLIELRPGVKDLDLNGSNYAQVRILVDNGYYLKGMAVYNPDLPEGVDVRFNTNKPSGTPIMGEKDNTVLKMIKNDPNNPFGSLIKEHGGQYDYLDDDGNWKQSLINKRGDEGDWYSWGDTLPSQFLGKQSQKLIDRQLGLTIADVENQLNDILQISNPTLKKYYLDDFAEQCETSAVNLKAAALPGQKYQVLLPIKDIKDSEVYAPNFKDGTKVALIRFPHGGTFEIPIVTVNNKNAEGKKIIGENPFDAVGINANVASRLSGADFDGDTVMVIPITGSTKIQSAPALEALKDFEPKVEYAGYPGMKRMTSHQTQLEMGKVSNLITDMTLRGATPDELARAVRHSMVVIDAEKHNLDYKQSEIDNGISELKRKYQITVDDEGNIKYGGSSTLLSKAKSPVYVDKRQGSPIVNPDGSVSYKPADDLYYTKKTTDPKTGEVTETVVKRQQKSTLMAETDDAFKLSSGTPQENAYAAFANTMKGLAKEARRISYETEELKMDPAAKLKYAEEVKSLEAKLNLSKLNQPKERAAQIKANAEVNEKKRIVKAETGADPKTKDVKKWSQMALEKYRKQVGAARKAIAVTDREWEAIQKGAISKSMFKEILNYADKDELRKRSMPKATNSLSSTQINKIKAMKAAGFTNAAIADSIGKSVSTVVNYLKDDRGN